jgi:ATP-dependent DNA helicase pcrA
MLKKNIKYRVVGSFYFYNRKEIKDLLCYLRLINNHKDDVSLLRVINTPRRGIGDKTIETLTEEATTRELSLYETISKGKELEFKNLIEDLTKASESLSLTELIDEILEKTGIKKELSTSKLLEDEIRLENLNEFKGVTKSYEEEYGTASLEDFLNEVTLVSDMSEHQDSSNRVSLMTVHSVKGLEFDYVFIVGMEEGIFPHYNAINDGSNSAIEEERRLCYVAITRAKKELYITSADTRMLFGNPMRNQPSRFIDEIDKEYIDKERPKKLEKIITKVRKAVDKNATYEVGEHISHTEFGEGIVISVDKSIITVAFPHPFGIRKLMKGHPNITKL